MQELPGAARNKNGDMSDVAVPAEALPSLFLRRATLADLPSLAVAVGFVLRTAQEQDSAFVGQVLASAFPDMDWSPERTRERLWDDTTVRTVFLLERTRDSLPIATASARVLPDYPGAGYVHWVGARPDWRGQGLGRLATLATLHAFRDSGSNAAVLETDDFRIPALHVYARLGFRPEYRHPSHADRWAKIYAQHPSLKILLETAS